MSEIDNLLRLDEENDNKRQAQLYRNDYQFDPNRPLYQHPINLAHFITESTQPAFGQLVRILQAIHPNQQIRQKATQYRVIQQQINQLRQGQIDGLKSEVQKQIQQLKNCIIIKTNQIQKLSNQNDDLVQKASQLQKQIQSYSQFIEKNNNVLDYSNNLKQFQNRLKKVAQNSNNNATKLLSCYQHKYNNLTKSKADFQKLQFESKQVEMTQRASLKENEILKKQTIDLQNQVDDLQQELNQQKSTILKIKNKVISQRQSQNASINSSHKYQPIGQSSQNTLKFVKKPKKFIYTEEEKSNNYFLIFLVFGTILLLCLTLFQ